jgi:hypothetical protein
MAFEADPRLWVHDEKMGLASVGLAMKADKALSKAQIDSQIATLVQEMVFASYGAHRRYDSMEEYLYNTVITVPAPWWARGLESEPVDEEVVKDSLRKASFRPENIKVHIRKRKLKLRLREKYVYDITFSIVPSPELVELCEHWERAVTKMQQD